MKSRLKASQSVAGICCQVKKGVLLFVSFSFLLSGTVQAQIEKNQKKKDEKPTIIVVGSVAGRVSFAAPLVRDFRKKHKIDLKVYSGGSELGIKAVADRFADIAISSRPLTADERSKGLQDTLIAYDAIAVIVNKNHPLNNMTTKQLQKVLQHKIRSWQKLGGPDMPVKLLLPDSASGLRRVFLNQTLQGKELKIEPVTLSSTYEIISALREDSLAIGICSTTQTHFKHLKILQIDGILLQQQTIADGSYPYVVPMSLITSGAPDQYESLFIDWVLFGPASRLVAKNFFLSPVQQTAQTTQTEQE